MLGDILNIIGIVMSGSGLIGSIKSDRRITGLDQRISDAEQLLLSLTDDMQFVRQSLSALKDFDSALKTMNIYPVFSLDYVADTKQLESFLSNPSFFSASAHSNLRSLLRTIGQGKETFATQVPVVCLHGDDTKAFLINRNRLEADDIFGAIPIKMFDPEAVEKLSTFLTQLEMAKTQGDKLDVQFEEES